MNETCDRCGPAIRRRTAWSGSASFPVRTLHEPAMAALSAQGWTIWPLGVHALAPQASAPGDYVRPLDDAA